MTSLPFRSLDVRTGEPFGPEYATHGDHDVAEACAVAEAAFDLYRDTGLEARAQFLERIGENIAGLGDALIEMAVRESGLPRVRIEGERGRTIGQLRLFAGVVRSGNWMGLRVDPALPDRTPLPRPDLRLRMIPLGPVAVFGASNFPLAFSTAGGDTASALASGCPVVLKGHPAHPGTDLMVAGAIRAAVADCKMPAGVFAHLMGRENELGAALVRDPRIAAVGFTGSRRGGLALLKLAQQRDVPIPVYAEMSSINPVVLMPEALKTRGAALGAAYVASLTLGVGQFCTNPRILLAVEGDGLDAFVAAAAQVLTQSEAGTMLTASICGAYQQGAANLARHPAVHMVAEGRAGSGHAQGRAAIFSCAAADFIADPALAQEVFGPSSLVVRARNADELYAVLTALEGQLTATLHMDAADEAFAARLLPLLERKAGRIIVNAWPTGVEVTHAMVHGGPYPATSESRTTSVGSLAIDRFLRPVSYQSFPANLLPPVLRDAAAEKLPPAGRWCSALGEITVSLRLLQHRAADGTRSVIAATSGGAAFVEGATSVRALAMQAISRKIDLARAVAACGTYGDVHIGAELSAGRLIAPIDHEDPAHLLMTGTGLTHLGSAASRDKMHREAAEAVATTDSMRMFLEGVAGGKPAAGEVGQQPEWFYKGDGSSLVGPEQPLHRPAFAHDGGEEPELAGIYVIGPDGTPFRIGLCLANEFSDHVTEPHNYLWLAHSKLRQASLGPELLVGIPPAHVEGVSRIHRGNAIIWEQPFLSGEQNMSHTIANLEAHHFKYDQFRRPGDVHVHFFGTATLSFGGGVKTELGDIFEIEAAPLFTLPLRNRLAAAPATAVAVGLL